MLSYRDRFRGALVGVLAGDVLGAPYERMSPSEVNAALDRTDGKLAFFDYPDPFHPERTWPAGRPTDDSEQTAALAQSLAAYKTLHEPHVYELLHSFAYQERSFLWDGPGRGAGRVSKAALAPLSYKESRALPDAVLSHPSNGSLMRTSSIALRWFKCHGVRSYMARRASWITHRSQLSADACIIYCTILDALLAGDAPDEAVRMGFVYHLGRDVFSSELASCRDFIDEPPWVPNTKNPWRIWGRADYSLTVALRSLIYATDFASGIERAIRHGGDTDTYAAIAGGLLGAQHGLPGIPEEWQSKLLGVERMTELADTLYEQWEEYLRKPTHLRQFD